jgi:hypothetical protein
VLVHALKVIRNVRGLCQVLQYVLERALRREGPPDINDERVTRDVTPHAGQLVLREIFGIEDHVNMEVPAAARVDGFNGIEPSSHPRTKAGPQLSHGLSEPLDRLTGQLRGVPKGEGEQPRVLEGVEGWSILAAEPIVVSGSTLRTGPPPASRLDYSPGGTLGPRAPQRKAPVNVLDSPPGQAHERDTQK